MSESDDETRARHLTAAGGGGGGMAGDADALTVHVVHEVGQPQQLLNLGATVRLGQPRGRVDGDERHVSIGLAHIFKAPIVAAKDEAIVLADDEGCHERQRGYNLLIKSLCCRLPMLLRIVRSGDEEAVAYQE